MRWAMMIDLRDCIGCLACVSACKEQWDSGPGAARDWVHTYEHGRRGEGQGITFYPGLCMQCEEHPCTLDCPTGATYRNERGVVVVDPDICIGCGNCVSHCPYGARRADPVKGIVEKCNLCEPHVLRGDQPACVRTCLAECRVFGDLDDPQGPLVKAVAERGAKPLVTAEVDVRPKVTFAGDAERERLLAAGVVRVARRSRLTGFWRELSLPFVRYVVPGIGASAIAGGLLVNWTARRQRVQEAEAAPAPPEAAPGPAEPLPALAEPPATPAEPAGEIHRHRLGMRFLHWFNALSWVFLMATGVAVISNREFALFGTAFPAWFSGLFGGPAALLRAHAVGGLVWAAVIVPLFLLFKRGGLEALEEVRPTRDDLVWMLRKPLAMLGRSGAPLPPQDKYNAGQKAFAISAVLGTALIIATGLVMTFHLGSSQVVALALVVHKLAIALAFAGLSVHLTMAAVVHEERPALRSMVTGRIDREHAEAHSPRWVERVEREKEGRS